MHIVKITLQNLSAHGQNYATESQCTWSKLFPASKPTLFVVIAPR
jgi:hypothetical protein